MTTAMRSFETVSPDVVRRLEAAVQSGIAAAQAEGRLMQAQAHAALERLNRVRFEETYLRRGKGELATADARRLTAVLERLAREFRLT